MSITNGYCTLAELKSYLDIDTSVTKFDDELEDCINGISRWIDEHCNTRFYESATDETKYFTPKTGRYCPINFLLSITSLKTDDDFDGVFESEWASTDYNLVEYNDYPKFGIETTLYGDFYFSPLLPRSVEVVGKWGYSSTTPPNVKLACKLQSARMFKRRDSILGIQGTSQFGMVRLMASEDPDILSIINAYRSVV